MAYGVNTYVSSMPGKGPCVPHPDTRRLLLGTLLANVGAQTCMQGEDPRHLSANPRVAEFIGRPRIFLSKRSPMPCSDQPDSLRGLGPTPQ